MPDTPATFHTLLTRLGASNLVNGQAFGQAVPITHIAVGDGGGAPVAASEDATRLVREVFRVPISTVSQHAENDNWLVIEAIVPANVGGWTIREAGLFGGLNMQDIADTPSHPGNSLLAYCNFPETYKPHLSEGAAKDLCIRMIVQVSNAALVELKVDPSVVVATVKNIGQALAAHNADRDAHKGLFAPLGHLGDPKAHEDIRQALAALSDGAQARVAWFGRGQAMPDHDIGPIWHEDYASMMAWQVFDANGADYAGYASVLVGSLLLDTQPAPRRGYVASGTANLSRAAYAALRGWAMHSGIMVSAGAWQAGAVLVADNADGATFRLFDLRGEFLRAADGGRGADAGRGFGGWQGDAVRNITGGFNGFDVGGPEGAFGVSSLPNTTGPSIGSTRTPLKISFDASRSVPTASENRPRNAALLPVVKF